MSGSDSEQENEVVTETEETPKQKPMNTKHVRRRFEKINASDDAKVIRKRKAKLAQAILAGIAAGEVKNPASVAKAFMEGISQEAAETDSES